MTKLRHLLEPAAGLLLNAVTGVVAWLLLVLMAGCVMLIPMGGLGFPLLAHMLVPVRALTRFQLAWAAHALGHEITWQGRVRLPAPGSSSSARTRRAGPPGWRSRWATYAASPLTAARSSGPQSESVRGRTVNRPHGEPHRRIGQGRTGRDLAWLAIHAFVGPSCVLSIGALLSSVDVIVNLRPLENSRWQTLTLSLAIVAFVAIAVAAIPLLNGLQARLAERLLQPAPSLARRVRELTESRAAAVDAQAAELRRIERDLHDGAQARLISVRMSLGLVKGASDPDQVRALVQEAWESAGQALVDLRDLVRGIHPPVLADRGLAGAIQSAALLCPIPVEIDIDLPARPEAPVESAVYFAAVETLTNVTKHSHATRAWVRLRHEGGILRLAVGDDGRGGADPTAGTGLDGIRRRLSAFDGTLAVYSPPGGPTQVTMELPCALSSPKI